jgi:hypothetical protein
MSDKNAGMKWIERLCWLFFIVCAAEIALGLVRTYL